MKLSREEQETVIRASAADDCWDIWTCDPRIIRLLKRRGYITKSDHQSKGGDAVSVKIPSSQIVIRSAKRRTLTEEERLKAVNTLQKCRASQRKNIS